jgi:hypothetical protein
MMFQRVNRSDPEKVFIIVYNSYSSASLSNGQAVMWDYGDANGVSVTKPASGLTRTSHYGVAFAGIAAETIAAGAYGIVQVYGYHSAVRMHSNTGGNPAITAGTGLVSVQAEFCLSSYQANASATTTTQTTHNAHWVGFALASQALYTTVAVAAFIKAL